MKVTTLAASAALAAGVDALPKRVPLATEAYPGWDKINYALTFGDSYSQTGFNYTLTAPTPSNPFGNPPYPGWTSSNGPNWIGYLTTKYNASLLQTYNLAYGGATVDGDLVAPYAPQVLSVKQQVQDEFLPGYTGASPSASQPLPDWKGDNSVFGIWIGINDVGNSYYKDNVTAINDAIFTVYSGLVDQLYEAGARNFFFLNVPPTQRSPLVVGQGDWSIEYLGKDIASWNEKVATLASNLKTNKPETNVWTVDTNKIFNQVLDNPAAYPQTAGYKNVTGYCAAYENGTPAPDTSDPSCSAPVNEYFWLNSLHPTYPIHDVVAEQVAKALSGEPNVG